MMRVEYEPCLKICMGLHRNNEEHAMFKVPIVNVSLFFKIANKCFEKTFSTADHKSRTNAWWSQWYYFLDICLLH
jgi:hypothetical protein